MTALVGQIADVITGSMITNSITVMDVMNSDSINGKDVTNNDSSAETENLDTKDGPCDTSTIIAAVSPSRQRRRTICELQ